VLDGRRVLGARRVGVARDGARDDGLGRLTLRVGR